MVASNHVPNEITDWLMTLEESKFKVNSVSPSFRLDNIGFNAPRHCKWLVKTVKYHKIYHLYYGYVQRGNFDC